MNKLAPPHDIQTLSGLSSPIEVRRQRIITNSMLKRLDIQRRMLLRQRVYRRIAWVLFVIGIGFTISSSQVPASIADLAFLTGMTTYMISLFYLVGTMFLWQYQVSLSTVLDLIDQNRASLELLDTYAEHAFRNRGG